LRKDLPNRHGRGTIPQTQIHEKNASWPGLADTAVLGQEAFLTPYLTTVRSGTPGNSGFKSAKKYSIPNRKCWKVLQITTKNLVQAFGTIRSGVRVSHLGPAKKPVFDFGQKQVSFCLETIVFPETVKYKDYNRFRYPFTSL
jgi:hypothetical protein